MKIILGTDFSDNAAQAGAAAAAIAAAAKDSLVMVHSLESGGLGAVTPGIMESLIAVTGQRLREEAARLEAEGATVRAKLVSGLADEAILREAGRGTRFIVVSSLGRRASERWLPGSVSERVAETAPVPTLVVRHAGPLTAWARSGRPLRVFCAYDFTTSADAALAWVKELRRIGPCEVTVAQVAWPFGEQARLGLTGPMPLDANPPAMQAILERLLREKVDAVFGAKVARIRVEPGLGRPDFRLIEMARAAEADLIVTGAHQRHGLERLGHASTSRGLLHYAPMNVLVVPLLAAPPVSDIPEIRRVLAPTDFSPLAAQAVPHAYGLVKPGGTVHLLHVIPPFDPPNPLIGGRGYAGKPSRRAWLAAMKTATARLRHLAPHEAAERGITSEPEVVEHEDAATAICQAVERCGADAICLASHGRSGLLKAMLGSVAEKVLAQSRRPVFIVRPQPR
jgi:nucleotide-binding universal stress UspA family protein